MRITSTKNPLVRRLRDLADRPAREQEGRMVVEGVRLVAEVLDARVPVELLLYDPAEGTRDARLAALVSKASAAGARLIEADPHVIQAASQVDTPQGVLAVVEIPKPELSAILDRPDLLLVVADRIQDPGNLGTIIRVADAAGATGVVATRGTVDPYNPKAVRATMGSLFHVPVVLAERSGLIKELKARTTRILVADQRGAVDYTAASYAPPLAIVLGGEAEGAHPDWKEAAVTSVRIPLYGRAESLNVAIAAALLLYEARRTREGQMMEPVWTHLDKLPEREVRPGIFLRILPMAKMMFSGVRFAPHATVPTHQHPHEQMGIVMEGELDLWIGDDRRTLRRGDMYTIPPNVPHGAETKASTCLVLDVFHPLREDYVKLFG